MASAASPKSTRKQSSLLDAALIMALPGVRKRPPGKTSLPGFSKDADACFLHRGSLDEEGGCTGPDISTPDVNGMVTRAPTTDDTKAPTAPDEACVSIAGNDEVLQNPQESRQL